MNSKMDPLTAKQILFEYAERHKLLAPPDNKHIDFDKILFDKQVAFINDPCHRKAALTSRRAGKVWPQLFTCLRPLTK